MENGPFAASELLKRDFVPDADPNTSYQFSEYVRAVLQVCPGCMAERRGDDAWIFVPASKDGQVTRKNLTTVWLRKKGLFVKIIPADIAEYYDRSRCEAYSAGLQLSVDSLDA